MACVKTAISIQESLFKQAEELARKLQVSRSKLVSLALEEYVGKHRTEELVRQIREAYEGYPDEEEREFLRLANASSARLTEDDEW
jgi:metal-responsive CopG/Arc/MetJ family transcriptional regulator